MSRLSCFLCSIIVVACGTDSSEIGSDFFLGGAIDLAYIDSASVHLSTIKFERLVTNIDDRILAGSYQDERLGRTTAIPFIQFSNSGTDSETLRGENPVFDYAGIVLKYDGYSFMDTTAALSYQVYRLTTNVSPDENGYLYNTTLFGHQEESLGSITFLPKPHREDSIVIRLPGLPGNELFQMLIKDSQDTKTYETFTEYFKGVAILPDTASVSCILGFSNNPEIRLYYYDRSVVPSAHKYISFPATDGRIFTWIHGNRNSTKLSELSDPEEKVEAALSDNEAYMQSGTGLALRADMPYLRNLKQLDNFYVAKALLELYPVAKSYSTAVPLPEALIVSKYDGSNILYGYVDSDAILQPDLDLDRDTHYELEVTSFVKDQMELEEFNSNGLVFRIDDTDFRSTVQRLYMSGAGFGSQTRLRIYYATINY
jgi:Domain of unknown function (DUF4270)